jgi:hypothetical protein
MGTTGRERLAEVLRQRKEQRQREAVIVEFAGDPHAMAAEILRHRHGLAQLGMAVEWAKQGAPFATIGPGSHDSVS